MIYQNEDMEIIKKQNRINMHHLRALIFLGLFSLSSWVVIMKRLQGECIVGLEKFWWAGAIICTAIIFMVYFSMAMFSTDPEDKKK
jgi:hypothetical protein